jgi:hypothetical protein
MQSAARSPFFVGNDSSLSTELLERIIATAAPSLAYPEQIAVYVEAHAASHVAWDVETIGREPPLVTLSVPTTPELYLLPASLEVCDVEAMTVFMLNEALARADFELWPDTRRTRRRRPGVGRPRLLLGGPRSREVGGAAALTGVTRQTDARQLG